MKNWINPIFVFAVAYCAVFAEATFDPLRRLIGVQVNILPSLMVYAGLTSEVATVGALALCGGLWFDSFSLNPLGTSALPLFIIGFAIYQYRDVLLRDNSFAQLVLGLAASAIAPLISLFLLLSRGGNPLLGWKWLWQWIILSLAGGVLTPLCFSLFDRLHRAFNYQPIHQSGFRPDREIKRGRG